MHKNVQAGLVSELKAWARGVIRESIGACANNDRDYVDQDRIRAEPGPWSYSPDLVLTMCPVNTHGKMVGRVGFEPTTSRLKAECSTTELTPPEKRYVAGSHGLPAA